MSETTPEPGEIWDVKIAPHLHPAFVLIVGIGSNHRALVVSITSDATRDKPANRVAIEETDEDFSVTGLAHTSFMYRRDAQVVERDAFVMRRGFLPLMYQDELNELLADPSFAEYLRALISEAKR